MAAWLGGELIRCTVPVNVKDEDTFHLTIEEYLLALVSLIEELVLLANVENIQRSLTFLRRASRETA